MTTSAHTTCIDALVQAFLSMSDGDDRVFCDGIARETAAFVQKARAITTDAGTVPTGAFTGAGDGSIAVQASLLAEPLYSACMAMRDMTTGGNNFLAAAIAQAVDAMMIAGIVSTTVAGAVVTPAGVSSALAGTAQGSFAGNAASIEQALKAAFIAMDDMIAGGNEHFATEYVKAVSAYILAGAVSTAGQGTIAGSAGQGVMAWQA